MGCVSGSRDPRCDDAPISRVCRSTSTSSASIFLWTVASVFYTAIALELFSSVRFRVLVDGSRLVIRTAFRSGHERSKRSQKFELLEIDSRSSGTNRSFGSSFERRRISNFRSSALRSRSDRGTPTTTFSSHEAVASDPGCWRFGSAERVLRWPLIEGCECCPERLSPSR